MSAKSQVGDSGHPGDQYDIIQFELERLGLDTYEARARWRKGSNQGHCLEDHRTITGRHRSTAPAAALFGLLVDVLNWDTGHVEGLIRSAIKDCLYDFEDQESEG